MVRRRALLALLVAAGCNREALDPHPDAGDAVDLAIAPAPPSDLAFSTCRIVEAAFTPTAANLQLAVWLEDAAGRFVDTLYVTRATATFGIGNRPGHALLKTDFRWPYGRREMVLPIWAHRRDHHYPKLVMGGACGNSTASLCADGTACAADCDDDTITYHSRVSSWEPYFCSPSGASRIDAMSCASRGTFSKGAFAAGGAFSLYPPRSDLTEFRPEVDSPDILGMGKLNDLAAVSQATPAKSTPVVPVSYDAHPLSDGDYVLWVEAGQESDFNASHNHPCHADPNQAWDFEGHCFLGQPSVVYRVPFHLDRAGAPAVALELAGYSTWDGSDGVLHPPDGTITLGTPGTGAGRLGNPTVAIGSCP